MEHRRARNVLQCVCVDGYKRCMKSTEGWGNRSREATEHPWIRQVKRDHSIPSGYISSPTHNVTPAFSLEELIGEGSLEVGSTGGDPRHVLQVGVSDHWRQYRQRRV